ncbi:MAG TPA: HlyC/CorC family transporter [Candidatus Aminicenantes bacterium]|nr:HlyC/CorC family transporter [Candidatus Aminicenantes bacterium]
MLLPGLALFALCVFLYAFFSAAETSFIAVNPFALQYREKAGSKRASLVRRIRSRTNEFLATILIGNTLVNVAASAIATSICITLIPNQGQAVLVATVATTLILLVFAENTPKTMAAQNPLKTSLRLGYPVRGLMVLLFPLVKALSFVTGLLIPSSRKKDAYAASQLSDEEIRITLHAGARGLSGLRRRIVSGALDFGSRPVKEVMVPRPEIRAFEIGARLDDVVGAIRSTGYSRFPVFRGRLDNVEGIVHSKDVIAYLTDNKAFSLKDVLRKTFFVPDLASLEQVLLQMQDKAVHMALVVDEFGNVDGLVTLEDIIEEIVGEIQDEHDGRTEAWYSRQEDGRFLVAGFAPIKEVNGLVGLRIPDKPDYTTLAGFFLYEFGRIPREQDTLAFGGFRLTVEKMIKRRITLIAIAPAGPGEAPGP